MDQPRPGPGAGARENTFTVSANAIDANADEMRRRCVVCSSAALEGVWHFESFPVFMGCTEQLPNQDVYGRMTWAACARCGAVQLATLPPVQRVYLQRHTEAIGRVWKSHESRFGEFVEKHSVASVVSTHRIELTGHALSYPRPRVPRIGTFVHSHAMEHWRRPRGVLKHIAERMRLGSRMIFSIPAMDGLLEAGHVSTLNFEHTYYVSDRVVRRLLQNAGFAVIAAELFAKHSIFYACERRDLPAAPPCPADLEDIALFRNAVRDQRDDVEQITRELAAFEGPAYVFGAHIFSQYLFALGLPQEPFEAVLDNSSAKQGKRLYGTGLKVLRPESIGKNQKIMVVLRSGPYDDEIREGVLWATGGNAVFC